MPIETQWTKGHTSALEPTWHAGPVIDKEKTYCARVGPAVLARIAEQVAKCHPSDHTAQRTVPCAKGPFGERCGSTGEKCGAVSTAMCPGTGN